MSQEYSLLPIPDIKGNDIHDGDTVRYNGNTYTVLFVQKDTIQWILHPCGNNTELDDITILSETMPVTLDDEYDVQLELIQKR